MVELQKLNVFLDRPLILHDFWVNSVQPAFAALLGQAAWQVLGHGLPLGGTVSLDDTGEDGVLLRRPLAIVIELILTDQLIVSLMSLEKRLI